MFQPVICVERALLIENGIVVTMDLQRRVIPDGSVAIRGAAIEAVGKRTEVKRKFKPELTIDAEGGIITPGFVCAHTHLYGILLRGSSLRIHPPTDFTQNLQRIWWPVDEALTHEDAYSSALSASLEFLRTGTTTFADTYSGPNSIEGVLDHIARAVEEVGIRGVISFEATQRHNHEEGFRGLKENLRFIAKKQNQKVMSMISLHASFTISDELIKAVVESSSKTGATVTIHTSEGLGDLYHNLERYGKRTVERLNDLGLLGPKTVLAHCVNVNRDELELIRKSDTRVAHNPMSNMLNAVGVAPVTKMRNLGITVGLGNDGYIFDVFENMRTAFILHKIHHRDPRVMTPLEVLEMATINAAKSYGLGDAIGSIEVGKRADIVVIKPKLLPTPLSASSVYGHLVNTIDGDDVDTVLVDGEVVLQERRPTKVKMDKVSQISRRSASKLWRRLAKVKPQVDYIK